MMEQELFIKYKDNPTRELRNEIVEKHLYMVDILIRKYLGKGVEYDDLYQVGALALVSAVERFDPEKDMSSALLQHQLFWEKSKNISGTSNGV